MWLWCGPSDSTAVSRIAWHLLDVNLNSGRRVCYERSETFMNYTLQQQPWKHHFDWEVWSGRKKNVCRQHQALHKNRAWLVRRLCDLLRRHNYWTILYDDQVLPHFPYRLQVYVVPQSGEWQENVINLQGFARSTQIWALSEESKNVGRTDGGEIGITHAVLRCPAGN